MIDRALATDEWVQCYQQAVIKYVVLEGSNHANVSAFDKGGSTSTKEKVHVRPMMES